MSTLNEPLFTQAGVVRTAARGISAYNRIEGEDYESRTEQTDEIPMDTPFPLPLYVIAAAALLG